MVRPCGGLVEDLHLPGEDRLHGRVAEPIGIQIHPVGPPATRQRRGDIAPRDRFKLGQVAGRRLFDAIPGVGARVHLAEEELAAQRAGISGPFRFEDAAHAAALIIVWRDQAVHAGSVKQPGHARGAATGHQLQTEGLHGLFQVKEIANVPALHRLLEHVVEDRNATVAALLHGGRYLEHPLVEEPAQAEQPVAQRGILFAGLPEGDRRHLAHRATQPVGWWHGCGNRRLRITPGGLELRIVTVGFLEIRAPSGRHDRAAVAEPAHDGGFVRALDAPEIGVGDDALCVGLGLVPADQRLGGVGCCAPEDFGCQRRNGEALAGLGQHQFVRVGIPPGIGLIQPKADNQFGLRHGLSH